MSRTRHMRRLMGATPAQRSALRARRASRGQTLLIFVLTFTVLLGFMGLAIDAVRVYDMYARMQRAAEAGALAGVIYLPNYYTSNIATSPSDNAVCRAWKEVHKNNFGPGCTDADNIGTNYCPATVSATEVAVCQTKDGNGVIQPHQLTVYVTESISVLFLSALGVAPLRLTVSATAEYIPPLALAVDPSNPGGTGSLGTMAFCNGVNCNGRPWALNINGPAELKEQGDPYVTCEEGNANSQVADAGYPTYLTYPNITYTGMQTNHPLYPQAIGTAPTNCTAALSTSIASSSAYAQANSDSTMQPFQGAIYNNGTNTPPTHSGYSFYVHASTDQSSVYVWNAPFSPGTAPNCNGRQWSPDGFFYCPGEISPYTSYPGSDYATKGYADPKLYFTTTYSLYLLNNGPADPYTQTYLGSFTALPYDTGGCTIPSTKFNITTSTCGGSKCVQAWCPLGSQVGDSTVPTPIKLTAGQDYRVVVVASSYYDQGFDLGWGNHGYGLEVCPPASTAQPCNGSTPAGQISSWSTMDALFLFPGKGSGTAQHTGVPLGVFSNSLTGRSIDVGLFDPGDTFGVNGGTTGSNSGFALVPTLPGYESDPCLAPVSAFANSAYGNFDPTLGGKTFNFPSWERVTTMDKIASAPAFPAIETSLNGDRAYNGLWVHETITLPADYKETNWSICNWGPGVDKDIVGISATTQGQSPVHLIQ